jgi:hypothetical protein
MKIEALLDSTQPVLYETGDDDYPYGLSGTCFPIRYNGVLFIITAFHCYLNFNIKPEQTLYPSPQDPTVFFAFDRTIRGRRPEAKDDEHYDQIALRVSRVHHPQAQTDALPALDIAVPGSVVLPTSSRIKQLWIRGYPHDAPKHGIDHSSKKITKQAFTTNGHIDVAKARFDFCYSVRMTTPIPAGMHPNGMSGSPIYGVLDDGAPVFCGTIILFNKITSVYIAIGPEVLVAVLKGATKSMEQQRQESAYFSWLSRGKPAGDDWADWFRAVEAITH